LTASSGTKVPDVQLLQAVPSASDKTTFTVDLKSKSLRVNLFTKCLSF